MLYLSFLQIAKSQEIQSWITEKLNLVHQHQSRYLFQVTSVYPSHYFHLLLLMVSTLVVLFFTGSKFCKFQIDSKIRYLSIHKFFGICKI